MVIAIKLLLQTNHAGMTPVLKKNNMI